MWVWVCPEGLRGLYDCGGEAQLLFLQAFWPPPPPGPCVDVSTYSNALELLICLSVNPTRGQVASAGPVP